MQDEIGIIGFGNMGSAIAERLKARFKIWVFDKDKSKTEKLIGISATDSIIDLVKKVEAVILAVKPQDFDNVLEQIKNYVQGKLVISIAAGISTGYIEKKLGKINVIRVMPNLPAKIGEGMICLCKGIFSSNDDLNFVKLLFGYLGETLVIRENQMNGVTAVSGSGPGFFYSLIQDKPKKDWHAYANNIFIPALSASAEKLGFTPDEARLLASLTTAGSLKLLEQSGLKPQELRAQVASQGGTTEAGLKVLQNSDERLTDAIKAAKKRAEELSKGG